MSSGSPSVDNQSERGGRSRTPVGTKPRSSSRASGKSRSTKGSSSLRAPTPPAPVQSSDSRAPSVQSTTRSSDSPTAYTPDGSEDTPTMPGQESVIAGEMAAPQRSESGEDSSKPARERSRSAASETDKRPSSRRRGSSVATSQASSTSSDQLSENGRGRTLRKTMRGDNTRIQPSGGTKQGTTDSIDTVTQLNDKPADTMRQVSRSVSRTTSERAEGENRPNDGGGTLVTAEKGSTNKGTALPGRMTTRMNLRPQDRVPRVRERRYS